MQRHLLIICTFLFLSVSDSTVSVTDAELTSYLKANASEFKRENTRSLEFVIFDIKPSSADTTIIEEEVAELKLQLAEANK